MVRIERAIQIGFRQTEFGQLQEWIAGFLIAQRIQVGQEMAKIAIGIDETNDVRLDARLLTVDSRSQLEPLEEQSPRLIDRGRILPPTFISRLQSGEVPAGRERRKLHGSQ